MFRKVKSLQAGCKILHVSSRLCVFAVRTGKRHQPRRRKDAKTRQELVAPRLKNIGLVKIRAVGIIKVFCIIIMEVA